MSFSVSPQGSYSGPRLRLSGRDLARLLPAGYANLASKGRWQSPPHLTYLSLKLAEAQRRRIKRLLILEPPRHGKQLADSTPILTTRGWTTHGALVAGDDVFGPDGRSARVLAVGPPSDEKVDVRFSDGTVIACHPLHEWTVWDRSASKWRTVETRYMMGQRLACSDRARFQLPHHAALSFPARALPVDPYTFGAWLGDGTSTAALFCGAADDLAHIVARIPYGRTSSYVQRSTGVHYQRFGADLRGALQVSGAWANKHIPDAYLFSAEYQRRALLAGLVDTDGSVNADGRVRFVGCNERLVRDVQRLVRSLGYRCGLQRRQATDRGRAIRDVQTVWVADWTPHDGVGQGSLPRKVVPRRFTPRKVGIMSIAAAAPSPGRCIQVDRADGLYLAGDALLPTHNSELVSKYFPAWWLGKSPEDAVLLSSYSDRFAKTWGRKARDVFQEFGPSVFELFLRGGQTATEDWGIAGHGGTMATAGIGGSIVGRGAELLIIDDPIKDQVAAQSQLVRDNIWDWWVSTASTRLAPDGVVVIVMCMTGDTPVTMASGVRKRLEDVRPGDRVVAWKDGQQVIRTVLNHASQGDDDVFELRTGNHCVRANGRHPFLVRRPDGGTEWRRLDAISRGDRVVGSGVERHHGRRMGADDAWLLGFMFGDGWVGRRKRNESLVTYFAASDDAMLNAEVLARFDARFQVRPTFRSKQRTYATEVQDVGRWFVRHGLVGGAKTKRLPAWLFSQALSVRRAFLAGFVSADGSIDAKARRSVCLANRPLVEDLRHLVRSCGMNPTNVSSFAYVAQAPGSPRPTSATNIGVRWQPTETDADFRDVAVRSVKPCGRAEVFDVEVDDAACFLADGLVSHNTHWHQDDLAGRLMKEMAQGGEQWTVIRMPAIAEQDEVWQVGEWKWTRKAGDALWPDRWPLHKLEAIKRRSSRWWAALYQQRPVPATGYLAQRSWFPILDQMPAPPLQKVRFWDCAGADGLQKRKRESSDPDWTVGALMARDGARYVIEDIIRVRTTPQEVNRLILQTAKADGEDVAIREEMEGGSSGGAIISSRRIMLAGYNYVGIKASGSKEANWQPMFNMAEAGNVWLLQNVRWNKDFLDEVDVAGGGDHDDQLDACAGAFKALALEDSASLAAGARYPLYY